MSLIVRAEDEAAAQQLEDIVDRLLKLARQTVLAEVSKQAASSDPVEQAMAKYMQRVSGRMFEVAPPRAQRRYAFALDQGPAGTAKWPRSRSSASWSACCCPPCRRREAAAAGPVGE